MEIRLGIIVLENRISVPQKNVFGIHFAIISDWSVVARLYVGQQNDSFEPVFGEYHSVVQTIKVPFSEFSAVLFMQF